MFRCSYYQLGLGQLWSRVKKISEPNDNLNVLDQANSAYQRGDSQAALHYYQNAIAVGLVSAMAYFRVGRIQREFGLVTQARENFGKAIEADPRFAEAYDELGMSYVSEGTWQNALVCFQEAYRLNPTSGDAINHLANLFQIQREFDASLDLYRRAILIEPLNATPYNNYGCVLHELGKLPEAIEAFRESIRVAPDYADPYYNLGRVLDDLNRFAEAMEAFQQADLRSPPSLVTKLSLCHRLQHRCDWDRTEPLVPQIRQLFNQAMSSQRELASPFSFLCLPEETPPAELLQVAQRWSSQFLSARVPFYEQFRLPIQPHAEAAKASRPLRVGYLSADFHDHATGWLIAEVLEAHDRQAVTVYAYSYGEQREGQLRPRLTHAVDVFRNVFGLADQQIAEQIAKDQIDILVDLKGYTRFSRPQILALRPSPIQVNYLGYPGTMGADFIDYIIADSYVIPEDEEKFFQESVVRVSGCYQANDSRVEIGNSSLTRTMAGLPSDAIVCCSFNQYYKLTRAVFTVWMQLMQTHPSMVLWLFDAEQEVVDRLRSVARKHHVSLERIVFAATLPHAEHLERLALADLFLDSHPVNAHTTASEALRQGVPIVTLSGRSFASRVAGSLLTHLGLSDLIATSLIEYYAIADGLIGSRHRLNQVRQRLQHALVQTDLFDGCAFARKLEFAYQSMWQRRNLQQRSPV